MSETSESRDRPAPDPAAGSAPSGTGLEANVAGALCYLVGLFTGILFLMLEKDRPSVRFHALQSIALGVVGFGLWIALTVIGMVPVIGWLVSILAGLVLGLGGFALWIYLMVTTYRGDDPELPVVGPWAREQAEGGLSI